MLDGPFFSMMALLFNSAFHVLFFTGQLCCLRQPSVFFFFTCQLCFLQHASFCSPRCGDRDVKCQIIDNDNALLFFAHRVQCCWHWTDFLDVCMHACMSTALQCPPNGTSNQCTCFTERPPSIEGHIITMAMTSWMPTASAVRCCTVTQSLL